MKTIELPEYIIRKHDGELFKRNEDDDTYSLVKSLMANPYRYTFERLMEIKEEDDTHSFIVLSNVKHITFK